MTDDFELKLQDALRRGASMEEIAALRPPSVTSPEAAIRALKQGNARFYGGQTARHDLGANERRAQILGQTPFASVLACSDSRVPVEMVFDQGFGDLFVTRVAGNVAEPCTLATVEYAILHVNVQLVVVLGHEFCGAVRTALMPEAELAGEPPHLRSLIELIRPALEDIGHIRDSKARMREAVLMNVRRQVAELRKNAVVQQAEERGQIKVIGAYYEIGSGAVDFLTSEEDLLI